MSTSILVIIPACRRRLKGWRQEGHPAVRRGLKGWHQEGHPAIKTLPQGKGTMIGSHKKADSCSGKKALKWCDDR